MLTLRFDPVLEGLDDGPLREFLKNREAVAGQEQYLVRDHSWLPQGDEVRPRP
ncbi:MAG: hypothetical protein OXC19_04935 [Bryobacterales bacterium]|nr:hypothetical protein [Bryobacterales bacterium]